jgi:glycerol-3-phosphate dehydrogenase
MVAVLDTPARPCRTAQTPLPGGEIARIREFADEQRRSHSDLPGIDHLWQMYGRRLKPMLGKAADRPELLNPLSVSGDIGAQILFAVHEEMAMTLCDVVMRRTGIGQLGRPDDVSLRFAAALMAEELGWSDERRAREIDHVTQAFMRSDNG